MERSPNIENKKGFRIEHLPGLDVVINLDYPEGVDQDKVLAILRETTSTEEKLKKLKEEEGNGTRFFVKSKRDPQQLANGVNGIFPGITFQDFDSRGALGMASVLNEIVLTKNVKEILNSINAKAIAEKHGYGKLIFAEPIVGLVKKDKDSPEKWMVYKGYQQVEDYSTMSNREALASELKTLFLEKGIIMNDFRGDQLMPILLPSGEKVLALIDIEAYRKTI